MAKLSTKLFEIDGRNGLWSVPAWCAQTGISEPTYYALDPQPHRAKLRGRGRGGRLARITESPREYAERIRRAG